MIVDHTDVRRAFRRLALPNAVAMLGDQLLGIVDTIAIGTLGAVALAGLTGAASVFIAVSLGTIGFMSGTGIIAAQRIGARDLEGYARTVRSGALIPIAAAAACAIASLFLAHPLLHAMVGTLPSAAPSATYLILRCFSLLPIAISGTIITGLGAAGNRAIAVLVLAIVNLVHLPLLFVLALGWLTHHPLGIVGAGISSLLSECIAAAFALLYVARRPVYRIFSSLRVDLQLVRRCAVLGSPEAVFLLAMMSPDPFIVAMLAPAGAVAISAFRALTVVSDLTFVVPSPLQSAAQTVIGQRLGAGDVAGAREFLLRARRYTVRITTATGAVCAALSWPLALLFTMNARIASVAALPLAAHMITLPLKGWSMVSMAPIRAAGDTRFSMTVGLVCSLLVFPVAFAGIRVLHIGLYAVPAAWILAWGARATLTFFKLRTDSWATRHPIAL